MIRQLVRRLLRRPGYGLAFVLPMALALAGTGIMFSLMRGVLLEPLPFAEPDRLVQIWERNPTRGNDQTHVTVADFYDWKSIESFESVAGYLPAWRMPMSGSDGAKSVRVGTGTYNLFDTLGVAPLAGRLITAADEASEERVVVVTSRFAIEEFGSARDAVGETLVLEGRAHEVIGVLDSARTLPVAELDVLVPIRHSESAKANRKSHSLLVVGRLARGATFGGAQAELDVVMDRIRREHAEEKGGEQAYFEPLHEEIVGDVRRPLQILLAAVGILLLIAVTNVSGLAAARTRTRAGELAVRRSLGASMARAVLPVAFESLLLTVLSGVLAVVAAGAGIRVAANAAADWVPRARQLAMGPADVAFVLGAAFVAALAIGLATIGVAMRSADPDALRGAGRTGAVVTRDRLRASIIVAQVAMSFVLLCGTAVLVRSMIQLVTTDPGYRTGDILTVDIELPSGRYEDVASQTAVFRRMLEQANALPGVAAAAATSSAPITGARITRSFSLEGGEPVVDGARRDYPYLAITPGYFDTMAIPVVRGRPFDERDQAESSGVIIVNEAFARRESPAGEILGRRLSFRGVEGPWLEIVGVVADTRHSGVEDDPEPMLFVPDTQRTWTWLDWTTLVVRADGDPAIVAASLRNVIRSIEPEIPVDDIRSVEQNIASSLGKRRFQLRLIGSFAILAVGLAVIGLYALVRNALAMRAREVGVRLALGAGPDEVVRLFAREGLGLVAAGVGIGLVISAAVLHFLEAMVVRVSPNDPVSVAAAIILFLVVGGVSCWVPSRRAAAVDPAVVLRAE